MKAIIIAAGMDSRLNPLSNDKQKYMLAAYHYLFILDLLRNNLEKSGERISVKMSNMRGAMDALEGSIS